LEKFIFMRQIDVVFAYGGDLVPGQVDQTGQRNEMYFPAQGEDQGVEQR